MTKMIEIEVASLSKIYDNLTDFILKRSTEPELPTGIKSLDDILWGLHRKELLVIGGRPSHGKSSLGLQIGYSLADASKKVWFLSLEMSKEHLLSRIFSHCQDVPYERVRRGQLTDRDNEKYKFFGGLMKDFGKSLFIADTVGYTTDSLEYLLQKAIKKPDVIIIDYVQRLSAKGYGKKNDLIEQYLKDLCNYAKKYNFAAVALSQINRQAEESGSPSAWQLKGSGSFEEDADTILLVNWKRRSEMEARGYGYEVIIAKQRHGDIGKVELMFEPEYFKLRDMESWEKEKLKKL